MKYQLVLQFEAVSKSDFDRLVAFEGKLERELGAFSNVDGHDFGSGEFNIFVFTDDQTKVFEKASEVAKSEGLKHDMRAAYREVSMDGFIILWPPDLAKFTIS